MCVVKLRTVLSPTSDPGGQWFYLGFSNVPSGPFGNPTPNPLFNVAIGGVLPGGDDPDVDTSGVDAGFYQVSYVQGIAPCENTNTVTIEVTTEICAGCLLYTSPSPRDS